MAGAPSARERKQIVEALAERLRDCEASFRPPAGGVISSGHPTLDQFLPERGLRPGTLVEWVAGTAGCGAGTLALLAAREASRQGGAVVVLDRNRQFYPPAALAWGIERAQLILVRPPSEQLEAWALDQILRWPGVAAVWCSIGLQEAHAARRLQLAAESSGVLGLLLRQTSARHEPSWADLRLLVEPLLSARHAPGHSRRVRIELLHSRVGKAGASVELELGGQEGRLSKGEWMLGRAAGKEASQGEIRHETRAVHLVSSLAAAKTRRRSRRA